MYFVLLYVKLFTEGCISLVWRYLWISQSFFGRHKTICVIALAAAGTFALALSAMRIVTYVTSRENTEILLSEDLVRDEKKGMAGLEVGGALTLSFDESSPTQDVTFAIYKAEIYLRGIIFMYDNYVFDLYGTLADIHTDEFKDELWQVSSAFYCENGAEYSPEEFHSRYDELVECEKADVHKRHPEFEHIDIRIEKVFRKLFEEKGVSPSDQLIDEAGLLFRRTSRDYIRLYDGIMDLLQSLKKYGKVYLLTNAQRSFTWDELGILGIRDIFDGIIISSDEECCKPDIHFYKALIKRFGLDPAKTVMVGNDPVTDIGGGKNAGFDTLYIHTNISPAINLNTGCTYFIANGDTTRMKDHLI